MIRVQFTFTFEEARYFFETAGLEVKQLTLKEFYQKDHLSDSLIWVVMNPHTRRFESLKLAFSRCVSKDRFNLSEIGKAEIYNSFEKK